MANINFALPPEKDEEELYEEETRFRGGSSSDDSRRRRIVLVIFIVVAVLVVAGVVAFMLLQQSSAASTAQEISSAAVASYTQQDTKQPEQSSSGVSTPVTERPVSSSSTSLPASSSTSSSSALASTTVSSSKKSAPKSSSAAPPKTPSADDLRSKLDIVEDYRPSFEHGDKPKKAQKYVVLHDTESSGTAQNVVDYWDSSGNLVAAHFVVNRDGSIVQCVPLDVIAHHAGFGDVGHNAQYGVEDESRDDKEGTVPIGDWAPDYGMNSYSIGIEMCHVGGEEDYSVEQLSALDGLIAYLDAYYDGNAGTIIDHKAWRSGNSDTSAEFAEYLENYKNSRNYSGS